MIMDPSDKELDRLQLEIAAIDLLVETTDDETLQQHLMLRRDVVDHLISALIDEKVEEDALRQEAINDLLDSI